MASLQLKFFGRRELAGSATDDPQLPHDYLIPNPIPTPKTLQCLAVGGTSDASLLGHSECGPKLEAADVKDERTDAQGQGENVGQPLGPDLLAWEGLRDQWGPGMKKGHARPWGATQTMG